MKKLMIALASVAIAAVASAASIDWSVSEMSFLMSDGETKPNGTTVYLLNADSDAFATLSAGLKNRTLGENLAAVMASTAFTGSLVGSAQTWAPEEGMEDLLEVYYGMVATPDGDPVTATSADLTAATTYNFALFVADGKNYMLTSTVEGMTYASDPAEGSTAAFSDTEFEGGWSTYKGQDVPEPTSGLLLLLGVAGLALRRKQK